MSTKQAVTWVGYTRAIQWIATEDDTDFLDEEDAPMSVTLSMVADLWNKTEEQAKKDLRRALDKIAAEKK